MEEPTDSRSSHDSHGSNSGSRTLELHDAELATQSSDALHPMNLKPRRSCGPPLTAACCCHCFYVCQFLIFMVIFPLWTKWLVTNPMPTQYWHEAFPSWPAISAVGGQELAMESAVTHPIQMSPIPKEPDACNYSCSSWRGYRTNEMNFRVSLALNHSGLAKGFVHTVYPVLLASSDFNDWWVVADRRHAWPSPFWRAQTAESGHTYVHDTDSCTRPPENADKENQIKLDSDLYVLACLVWKPSSFAELESLDELDDSDIASYCQSAGGVCGWTCDSVLSPELLEGCTAQSSIEMTRTSVAGREIPGANFVGEVQLKQCESNVKSTRCETSMESFRQWTCHNCLWDPRTEDDMRRLSHQNGTARRLQIPGIGGLPSPPSGLGGLFGDGDTDTSGSSGSSGSGGFGGLFDDTKTDAAKGPMNLGGSGTEKV
eukprot:symbB.v1.2.018943.t1/scaffold1487.1/size223630/13